MKARHCEEAGGREPEKAGALASLSGKKTQSFTMASLGARGQFEIAFVLAVLIPLLVGLYLLNTGAVSVQLHRPYVSMVLLTLVPLVLLGLWLMARYPRTVVRLRRYLERMATGELPFSVSLPADEDDLIAIGGCLRTILKQTRRHIETIERQSEALVCAERERVMMESLGAACHHIAQPAMALSLQVSLLERERFIPRVAALVREMRGSTDTVCAIVKKMQNVERYRTVSYLRSIDSGLEIRILDIEPTPASGFGNTGEEAPAAALIGGNGK